MKAYLVVIVYKTGTHTVDRVYGDLQGAEAYCDQFRESFRNDTNSGIDFVYVTQPYVIC